MSKIHLKYDSASALTNNQIVKYNTSDSGITNTNINETSNGSLTAGQTGGTTNHTFNLGDAQAFTINANDYAVFRMQDSSSTWFTISPTAFNEAILSSNGVLDIKAGGASTLYARFNESAKGIGINTQSPTARLHVVGYDDTASNHGLKVDNYTGGTLLDVRNDGNLYYNTNLNLLRTNSGTNRILIGNGTSTGSGSVGIGDGVTVSGVLSVAIGASTTANNESAVGIGYASTAGYLSVGVGRVANASGSNSVAVGDTVTSESTGVAIGSNSYAAVNSVAIGRLAGSSSFARGNQTISIGYITNSNGGLPIGESSTAVGSYSYSSGIRSGVFGNYLKALSGQSFVFGTGIESPAAYLVNDIANSLMFGCNSDIPTLFVGGGSGTGTTGNVGIGTSLPTEKLVVSGNTKLASTSNKYIIGAYDALSITQAASAPNTIVGHGNTMNDASNGGGIVIGSYATSTSDGIAIGLFSNIGGGTEDGIAIGRAATVNNASIRGVAIGRDSLVSASNAFAIGNYTTASQDDTIILGNNSTGNKPKIGIGTSTPSATLHVKNVTSFGNEIVKIVNSADTSILSVINTGNVGIGTATPNYKLDVNGNMVISGSSATNTRVKIGSGIAHLSDIYGGNLAAVSNTGNGAIEISTEIAGGQASLSLSTAFASHTQLVKFGPSYAGTLDGVSYANSLYIKNTTSSAFGTVLLPNQHHYFVGENYADTYIGDYGIRHSSKSTITSGPNGEIQFYKAAGSSDGNGFSRRTMVIGDYTSVGGTSGIGDMLSIENNAVYTAATIPYRTGAVVHINDMTPYTATTGNIFKITKASSEVLSLTALGYLGLNVSTPTARLQVNGDTRFEGNSFFNTSAHTIGTTAHKFEAHGTNANALGVGKYFSASFNTSDSFGADIGAGIALGGKYNSAGGITPFAGINGVKLNATDGNFDGKLNLWVRNGSTANVALTSISYGSKIRNGMGTTNMNALLHLVGDNADVFISEAACVNTDGYAGKFYAISANTSNNIGVYSEVSNGLNNYAGIFIGGNVGIGVTTPTSRLEVKGSGTTTGYTFSAKNSSSTNLISARDDGKVLIQTLTAGLGNGNIATNTAFGTSALDANTTGYQNTAIGNNALITNTTATGNTAVGHGALYLNGGSGGGHDNTAIGNQAMVFNNTSNASYNTAVGSLALQANTSGYDNTAIGYRAGNNTDIAFANNSIGRHNTWIGWKASSVGYVSDDRYYTTVIGWSGTVHGNSAVSVGAANVVYSADSIALGSNNVVNGTNSAAIGKSLTVNGDNIMVLGGNMNVGIGTVSPTARLDVSGATGYNQLRVRTSYTPSSSGDTNGNIGDIAWDNNYVYVKTNTGWGRSALDYGF